MSFILADIKHTLRTFNNTHLNCSVDVPTWLKSLRLHKYASLFSTMTYDEMMSLTEEQLEAQVAVRTHTCISVFVRLFIDVYGP